MRNRGTSTASKSSYLQVELPRCPCILVLTPRTISNDKRAIELLFAWCQTIVRCGFLLAAHAAPRRAELQSSRKKHSILRYNVEVTPRTVVNWSIRVMQDLAKSYARTYHFAHTWMRFYLFLERPSTRMIPVVSWKSFSG